MNNIEVQRLAFARVSQLSKLDKAYARNDSRLSPFYKWPLVYSSFERLIEEKSFPPEYRKVLVEALKEQYSAMAPSIVHQHIELLSQANTFTVTTAHQPGLGTGPLYVIYKILNVIHLAQSLRIRYRNYNFVPVFWSGDEDHDFEEVNHFRLFGKTITWGDYQGGSVGQYQIDSLAEVLETTSELLGNSPRAQEIVQILRESYTQKRNYKVATFHLIHRLFSAYGLIVLDSSKATLKALMRNIFRSELEEQFSRQLVGETTRALVQAGFKNQAHPRAINLFYLSPHQRNRIVLEDERYRVLGTDKVFDKEAIVRELEKNPQRFSPNVILRPLYQEHILPNLAYVGGGGELAYWLERKTQFEHFGVSFPVLIRRTSVLWVNAQQNKQLRDFELSVEDLFLTPAELTKTYLTAHSEGELSLEQEKTRVTSIFATILKKTQAVDQSLQGTVWAQQKQVLKALDKLEKRLVRAEKQKQERSLNKVLKLQDKLFPKGSLQERKDNLWNFYFKYGAEFIPQLLKHLDPMQKGFLILKEDDKISK